MCSANDSKMASFGLLQNPCNIAPDGMSAVRLGNTSCVAANTMVRSPHGSSVCFCFLQMQTCCSDRGHRLDPLELLDDKKIF